MNRYLLTLWVIGVPGPDCVVDYAQQIHTMMMARDAGEAEERVRRALYEQHPDMMLLDLTVVGVVSPDGETVELFYSD